MESHLREEIKHLEGSGLSREEAFLVARHRLGEPQALETEYAKVNADRRTLLRLSWMAAGALLYLLGGHIAAAVSSGGTLFAAQLGLVGYPLGVLRVALTVLTGTVLFLIVWAQSGGWVRHWREVRIQGFSIGRGVLLLTCLTVVAGLLVASPFFFRAATFRSLEARDCAPMVIVSGFARMGWSILAPILAAILMVTIHIRADRHLNEIPGRP